MPTKLQDVETERTDIKRRRALADVLMAQSQQGAPREWAGSRITPTYGVEHGLVQLGQALAGGAIGRGADTREDELNAQERQAMGARLRGLVQNPPIQPGQPGSGVLRPGQPAPFNPEQESAMQSIGALPLEQQEQILGQVSTERLFPTETGKKDRLVSPANPSDFEPSSLAEYQRTGDPSKLVPRNQTYGRYNPRDYTAESWATFVESNDPSTLVRTAPYQFRDTPGGGILGLDPLNPDKPTTVLSDPAGAAGAAAKAGAVAEATTTGEARGGIKSVRIDAAQRRLARVKSASEALKTGGPIVGTISGALPSGQELNQANAQLLTELTALTRTPGVGAQSDLEQRLAQLQLPGPEMYPAVRAKAIAELEAFISDLDAALFNVESQEGGAGAELDALLNKYAPAP